MSRRTAPDIGSEDVIKLERTGAHSHIKGIGATVNEQPSETADGMVGQIKARKAAALILAMVNEGKISGRGVMIAGPAGTGKTAIAVGLARSLGKNVPFTMLSAAEIYSLQMSKTEALLQAIRKTVGLTISEESDVIEGEVVDLQVDLTSTKPGARVARLTMKTTDMETDYDLGNTIMEALIQAKVHPGDVISIQKGTNVVTKIGRSLTRCTDYDAIGLDTRYVQCPQGELQRRKQVDHLVTLHEIDVINSRPQGYLALFSGDTGEISPEIRETVNKKMHTWLNEKKAVFRPGVLFIDEIHLLDMECFTFLNRAMEDEMAPLFVFASNRGVERVKGSNLRGPHGVPFDMLDRMVIIPTERYTESQLSDIIRIRAKEEKCELDDVAIGVLGKMACDVSLRYAMNLISCSATISEMRLSNTVTGQDMKKAYALFWDQKRSSQYLEQPESQFITLTEATQENEEKVYQSQATIEERNSKEFKKTRKKLRRMFKAGEEAEKKRRLQGAAEKGIKLSKSAEAAVDEKKQKKMMSKLVDTSRKRRIPNMDKIPRFVPSANAFEDEIECKGNEEKDKYSKSSKVTEKKELNVVIKAIPENVEKGSVARRTRSTVKESKDNKSELQNKQEKKGKKRKLGTESDEKMEKKSKIDLDLSKDVGKKKRKKTGVDKKLKKKSKKKEVGLVDTQEKVDKKMKKSEKFKEGVDSTQEKKIKKGKKKISSEKSKESAEKEKNLLQSESLMEGGEKRVKKDRKKKKLKLKEGDDKKGKKDVKNDKLGLESSETPQFVDEKVKKESKNKKKGPESSKEGDEKQVKNENTNKP